MAKVLLRDTAVGWWRFFWRYAVLLISFLLCGGLVINQLGIFVSPKSLFLLTICLSAGVNTVASLAVFRYILGRSFRNSGWMLEIPGKPAGTWNCLRVWLLFYWRFLLFSVAISFLLGALLPLVVQLLGFDPVSSLKYSKYIGNFAVLPASFFSFLFLMYRRESRRRLVLVPAAVRSESPQAPRFAQ